MRLRPRAEPKQAEPKQAEPKFTGQHRTNYEDAKAICGGFPPRKVARDLGLDVDVHTSEGLGRIAEKYAEGYPPNFRQAVFEGCLDGLPNP